MQKEKFSQKTKTEDKTTEQAEKSFQSSETIQNTAEVKKSEISAEKTADNTAIVQATENNSQKTQTENNLKSVKRVEYYPSGQKKSESEINISLSKISDEREFYKNRSAEYETKLRLSVKVQDSIYRQNLEFASKNKELIKINKESLHIAQTANEELKKSSDRSGISFGNIIWIIIVSFCAGAVTVPVLKKYIPVWISGFLKRK